MKLVIEDEGGTRSIVPLEDAVVVGRGGEGVSFRLTDRNVSRRHARFLRQSGVVFVEDLGSLNGTRVNGERITGKRRLRDGDLVRIGDYDLAILDEDAALSPGAPPPLPPLTAAPRGPGGEATTQRYLIPPPEAAAPPVAAPAPVLAVAARPARTLRIALAIAVVALAVALLTLATRP